MDIPYRTEADFLDLRDWHEHLDRMAKQAPRGQVAAASPRPPQKSAADERKTVKTEKKRAAKRKAARAAPAFPGAHRGY